MHIKVSAARELASRFNSRPGVPAVGLGDAIPGGDSNLLYTGTDSPPLPAPAGGAIETLGTDAGVGDDNGPNWPVLIAALAAVVLLAGIVRD